MNRLHQRLERYKKEENASPLCTLFITAGYPEMESFIELVLALDESGADILEIGMPFSDPLADGPVIQASSQKALDSGVDLEWIFTSIKEIRTKTEIPILLMGYFNPILSYGMDSFFQKAADSGIDGIILPDLPVEELKRIQPFTQKNDLSLIGFATPTSPDHRIQQVDHIIDGFLYTILVTGVTGGQSGAGTNQEVRDFLMRVRSNTSQNPIFAGFGIRTRADIHTFSDLIDGFIVGSELIRQIDRVYPSATWIQEVSHFVKSLQNQ